MTPDALARVLAEAVAELHRRAVEMDRAGVPAKLILELDLGPAGPGGSVRGPAGQDRRTWIARGGRSRFGTDVKPSDSP